MPPFSGSQCGSELQPNGVHIVCGMCMVLGREEWSDSYQHVAQLRQSFNSLVFRFVQVCFLWQYNKHACSVGVVEVYNWTSWAQEAGETTGTLHRLLFEKNCVEPQPCHHLITLPNVGRFLKFFTVGFSKEFAIKYWSFSPPHLNYVAALPCEM